MPSIFCQRDSHHSVALSSNVENFYLLKIHLNLFEIPNWVLKIENLISIWKFFILSENLFQSWILRSGAMCVYLNLSLSCNKVEYMHIAPLCGVHVWNRIWDRMNFFQIQITFTNFKLYLRFQINSNGFSRDRSFGHFWFFRSFLKPSSAIKIGRYLWTFPNNNWVAL